MAALQYTQKILARFAFCSNERNESSIPQQFDVRKFIVRVLMLCAIIFGTIIPSFCFLLGSDGSIETVVSTLSAIFCFSVGVISYVTFASNESLVCKTMNDLEMLVTNRKGYTGNFYFNKDIRFSNVCFQKPNSMLRNTFLMQRKRQNF